MTEHVPPQNIEAEESVVGAILVSENALHAVRTSGLQSEHFYLEKHRQIYAAVDRVVQREGYVDQLMLCNELPEQRIYVEEVVARVPAAGNAIHYARIVMAAANLRQKLEGGWLIVEGVRKSQEGGDDAREEGEELIHKGQALVAVDHTVEALPTTREELADDFYEYLDNEDPAEVFKLAFDDLNECVLGGYRRSQTTVLAGWTGMGKSWFLDQNLRGFFDQGKKLGAKLLKAEDIDPAAKHRAEDLAKNGYKIGLFATEMGRRERIARHVMATTGIPTEKLMLKKLEPAEYGKAITALQKIPFDYYEANGWSAEEICERIMFEGYDIAAVDVVNLIPGYEEAKVASRILSRFIECARKADCHLILVSHLNRARATATVKPRPVKRDLRDSGMLEANADAILFLHRDQADKDGQNEPGGEAFFDKVRNGMEGSVRVIHNDRYCTFAREAAPEPGDTKPDEWFQQEGAPRF